MENVAVDIETTGELRATDKVDGSERYERRTLLRTGDKPLAFNGALLGRADGDRHGGSWYDYVLFETAGGLRVGGKASCTWRDDVEDVFCARVLTSVEECFVFFGWGSQALELYEDAGIQTRRFAE